MRRNRTISQTRYEGDQTKGKLMLILRARYFRIIKVSTATVSIPLNSS